MQKPNRKPVDGKVTAIRSKLFVEEKPSTKKAIIAKQNKQNRVPASELNNEDIAMPELNKQPKLSLNEMHAQIDQAFVTPKMKELFAGLNKTTDNADGMSKADVIEIANGVNEELLAFLEHEGLLHDELEPDLNYGEFEIKDVVIEEVKVTPKMNYSKSNFSFDTPEMREAMKANQAKLKEGMDKINEDYKALNKKATFKNKMVLAARVAGAVIGATAAIYAVSHAKG